MKTMLCNSKTLLMLEHQITLCSSTSLRIILIVGHFLILIVGVLKS